ncbi:MAG: PQQ-dependent sugar dehydrogenase [Bryobacterales bacterium]|nr:PQQ-dependent sugar dehydrogenase [Bryobacterales bacterium]
MGNLFAFLLLAAAWPTIRWEPWITSGLEAPVDLQSPRDGSGRLFVVEQRGRVRLIRDGALVSTPVLDIVSKVQYRGEMGLLGLAFPPGFREKQYFYVNYVDRQRRTIVARYRVNGDTADAASEEVLLTIPQPYENHNGGCLQFSPRDGQLYIGMGDGGSGGDPQKFAQNPNSQLGKMLRMDVENGARTAQIWASGLRNPWRFSFDRANGDMYIADVGQGALEEVDFQPADAGPGLNYGWSLMEGTRCFDDRNCANRTDLVRPIFEYGRSEGISVTGGYVYRGSRFPFLTGVYLFGDFGSGQIWGTRRDGAKWETAKLAAPDLPVSTFGEDEAGEQYMVSHNGRILRLAADPPAAAVNAVVSAASFAPGLAPGGIATAFLNAVNGVSGVVAAERLPLPTTLSGLSVRVNGEFAPLFAVANSGIGAQVNFLIPASIAPGPATFTINGVEARATVAEAAPAVFTTDGRLAAVRGPGTAGQAIELYATGLGTRVNSVEVLIGGRAASVQFAGAAPGFVGLNQVNAVVPAGTPAGEAELVMRIGSISSPTVRLPIR